MTTSRKTRVTWREESEEMAKAKAKAGKSLLREPVRIAASPPSVPDGLDEIGSADDAVPGTLLVYKGDAVPFAKWAGGTRRDSEDGKALLPTFPRKHAARASRDRTWDSTPCVDGARWRVLAVETDRKGANGRPLDDLWLLESDELPGVLAGVGLANLRAKFWLAPEAALEKRLAEAAAEQEERGRARSFAEELRDAGW